MLVRFHLAAVGFSGVHSPLARVAVRLCHTGGDTIELRGCAGGIDAG